jgi:single-strand DNA-binding protein
MLNNCEFIGNLGKDPEIRTAAGGSSFTTFSIAVNKQGANREDKPLWVNVTAFGKTGEFVGKYLKQGNMVFVQGALELQEYEGKDGKNHVSVKLLANKVVSLSKKESGASAPAAQTAAAPAAAPAATVSDEDIPF